MADCEANLRIVGAARVRSVPVDRSVRQEEIMRLEFDVHVNASVSDAFDGANVLFREHETWSPDPPTPKSAVEEEAV